MTGSTLATPNRRVRREKGKSYLHLCVTVRAQKLTFRGLRPRGRERPRQPSGTQAEPFRARITVMELQGGDVAVVAADNTPAAGLRDKNLLDPPPPMRDAVGSALGASVEALRVEDEARAAVGLALDLALDDTGSASLAPTLDCHRRPSLQIPAA